MTRIKEVESAINQIETHIKKGLKFEEQGYDVSGMLGLSYAILSEKKAELNKLKQQPNLAGAFY